MNNSQKADKFNTIELVKHHRKYCEGENCCISLMVLMQMAEKTGVKFTKKELKYFI